MSVTTYDLDLFNANMVDHIRFLIARDCRCVKEVKVIPTCLSNPCCRVQVTRIDTGIWEWNDEVEESVESISKRMREI